MKKTYNTTKALVNFIVITLLGSAVIAVYTYGNTKTGTVVDIKPNPIKVETKTTIKIPLEITADMMGPPAPEEPITVKKIEKKPVAKIQKKKVSPTYPKRIKKKKRIVRRKKRYKKQIAKRPTHTEYPELDNSRARTNYQEMNKHGVKLEIINESDYVPFE